METNTYYFDIPVKKGHLRFTHNISLHILENIVLNFSDPVVYHVSERTGCYCITSHIELGRLGSFQFNSFRLLGPTRGGDIMVS